MLGIIISFGLRAQDSLQYRLNFFTSLWKNKAPATALQYYTQYRLKKYKRDAFMMYSSGVAFCLTDEFDKGKTNLELINNLFEDRDPRSPEEENKLLFSRIAHEKCVEDCIIDDFSYEFEPAFLTEADERAMVASNRSVLPNSGRATVNTGLNNKIKSSWFPGNTFVVPVSKEETYSEDTLELFENRLFEPFEEDIMVQRLKRIYLTRDLSMYGGKYFNIVSLVHHHYTEEEYDHRMKALEKSLSIFIRDFNFKLPLRPITIYVVENKNQLEDLARELHFTDSNEFSIGYSFIFDQSIVAITPNFLLGTINHEIVHILSKYNHTNFPLWYEEGLASIYEVSSFMFDERSGRTELKGLHNWRGEWLEKFLFMTPDVENFASEYGEAPSDEARKHIAGQYKEALVEASDIIKIRADSLRKDEFFLGMVSEDDIDLYEQSINYSLARYFVMYQLYHVNQGVGNKKTGTSLELFADNNELPFEQRVDHRLKSDPLTFLLWYFNNYYRSDDKTYDNNLPFAKDRSGYE